jgi:hypothetical protein
VLTKLAAYPRRLADLGEDYVATEMWHETMQQNDGTISRRASSDGGFPASPADWVLSGPHFFLSNPFNKTPRKVCTANGHYDVVDLETLPDSYLPRTNYQPMADRVEYVRRTPKVSWTQSSADGPRPMTDLFRMTHRKRLAQPGERTLITALVPPGAANVPSAMTTAFRSAASLVSALIGTSSLVLDFLLKSSGRADLTQGGLALLPMLPPTPTLAARALALNCLTTHYAPLWKEVYDLAFTDQRWNQPDNPRLPQDF